VHGLPSEGDGCHASFTGSPRFICHASCLIPAPASVSKAGAGKFLVLPVLPASKARQDEKNMGV
jgi:hypothetical protein